MSGRHDIINMAIFESNFGDWRPDGSEMVNFFKHSALAPPTAADLKRFANAKSNVPVNGKSIAWCGIFACYVLKWWGGVDVHWIYGDGMEGDVKKVWDYRNMRPGDVAVIKNQPYKDLNTGKIGYLHHHYIITEIDYAANTHSFVEGNGQGNKIWWRTDRPINQASASANDLKRPYCYYQPLA